MKIQNIQYYSTTYYNRSDNKSGTRIENKYLSPIEQNKPDIVSFTGIKSKLPIIKQARAAEKTMFRPFKGPNNIKRLPIELQNKVKETSITTKDGLKLNCWDIAPEKGMPYILYCHGLKKNLSMSSELLEGLANEGFGVFGVEYRGYAGNKGVSSRQNHSLDTLAAWDKLTKKRKIPPEQIFILGESLGGAISVDLAANCENMMGLTVMSSLTSAKKLAKHNMIQPKKKNKVVNISLSPRMKKVFKKLPSSLIPLENNYNSLDRMKKINCPVMFIHSRPDTEIPYKMSIQLAKAARKNNQNVELNILEDGDHFSVEEKLTPIIDFVKKLMNKSA